MDIKQRFLELAGVHTTASILRSTLAEAQGENPGPEQFGASPASEPADIDPQQSETPPFWLDQPRDLQALKSVILSVINNYSGPERESLENTLSRIDQMLGSDDLSQEQSDDKFGNRSPESDEPGMETRTPSRGDVVHQSHITDHTQESVNHMGEREQTTYAGWKRACKAAHPGCGFRGDKDIGAATLNGRDVGEWDGAVGSVYKKESIKEETLNPEVPFKATGPHTISDKAKSLDWSSTAQDDNAPNGELRYPDSPKVKIPVEVKRAVKDGKARAEEEVKKAQDRATLDNRVGMVRPANVDFYMDMLNAYDKIEKLFDEGTEDAFKQAQLFVMSLPNWMTHEFPVEMMRFISSGRRFDVRGSSGEGAPLSLSDRYQIIKAKKQGS